MKPFTLLRPKFWQIVACPFCATLQIYSLRVATEIVIFITNIVIDMGKDLNYKMTNPELETNYFNTSGDRFVNFAVLTSQIVHRDKGTSLKSSESCFIFLSLLKSLPLQFQATHGLARVVAPLHPSRFNCSQT